MLKTESLPPGLALFGVDPEPIPVFEDDGLVLSLSGTRLLIDAEGYETFEVPAESEGPSGDLAQTSVAAADLTAHPALSDRLSDKVTRRTKRVSLKSLAKALSIAGIESDRFWIHTGFLCADERSGVSLWLRWSDGLDLVLQIARNGWPVGVIPVGVKRGKRTHYLQLTTTKVLAIPELAELCAGKLRDSGSNSTTLHELVAIVGDGVSYQEFEDPHGEHHRNGNGGDNRLDNLFHIFNENHDALHAVMDPDRDGFLATAYEVGELALLPEALARSIESDHELLKCNALGQAPEGARFVDLSLSFDRDRMVASASFVEPEVARNPKSGEPKKDANGRTVVNKVVHTRTVTSDGLSVTEDQELPAELSPAQPLLLVPDETEFRWSSVGMDAFVRGEEPVTDLGERLAALVDRYVSFSNPVHVLIVVAYVAMSYVFPLARRVVFLAVRSLTHASGKSTLLEVLGRLLFNAVMASGATRAVIVRLADARCTLVLDEQEKLTSSAADDLVQVLNARHSAGTLYRTLDKELKPQSFQLFGPTVIANLAGLPPTLHSRAIQIEMRPMPAGDHRGLNKVGVRHEDWQWLRDQLYLWAGRNWQDVKTAYEHDPDLAVGRNRHADLWRLLLAVAKHLGGEAMFEALRAEALASAKPQSADETTEAVVVGLYRAIKDMPGGGAEIPLQRVCNLTVEHLEGAAPDRAKSGNNALNKRIKAFCVALGLDVGLSSRFNKANAIRVPNPEAALTAIGERFPWVLVG